MNLDPFQREVLAELGYRLYRLPAVTAAEPAGSVEPAGSATVADPLDRLRQALVRAAGTEALPQLTLAALRRDPAAKRALWPRLRSLRAAARTR